MGKMVSATVFGLDVWSDHPMRYLQGAGAKATGRVLDVVLDQRCVTLWPSDARMISAQRESDGTIAIRIDAHREAGYQLSGPRYGRHVISSDGRRLRCMPQCAAQEDWQRFMIGQVLPFAAAVNGLEVLHAAAVGFGRRALALVGPSGAGKTSLALALCALGGVLLADDVLALERREQQLFAHPGTPAVGVTHREAERLGGRLAGALTLAVNERERLIKVPLGAYPLPLRAVLFLEPGSECPIEPKFETVPGAGALLSSTFNFVLDDSKRLVRLLDVSQLAARQTVQRVSFGSAVDPDRLADRVCRWFESLR
jgi:hypothetical protein